MEAGRSGAVKISSGGLSDVEKAPFAPGLRFSSFSFPPGVPGCLPPASLCWHGDLSSSERAGGV